MEELYVWNVQNKLGTVEMDISSCSEEFLEWTKKSTMFQCAEEDYLQLSLSNVPFDHEDQFVCLLRSGEGYLRFQEDDDGDWYLTNIGLERSAS